MKVLCVNNTGMDLLPFEYDNIDSNSIGRFGVNRYSVYNEIQIGKEYLVMGIIIFKNYQGYLLDDYGFITVCPCPLFKIIDCEMSSDWCFRIIEKDEKIYPFIQAIFGYRELCADKNAYENLIVEKEEAAERAYFKRKIILEKELSERDKDKN